jgi:hypothetical protein
VPGGKKIGLAFKGFNVRWRNLEGIFQLKLTIK